MSEPIKVGVAAPKLDIKKWIKGTPISHLEEGKSYVVEFWATWCGPCRAMAPHLSQMAEKFTEVTFISVSILEDNDDHKVDRFVEKMGGQMRYNVAFGGKEGMADTWFRAAGMQGIPACFFIQDRKVAWMGHPMKLENILDQVRAGTFDPQAEAETQANEPARPDIKAIIKSANACDALHKEGKLAEAEEERKKLLPTIGQGLSMLWLSRSDPAAFPDKVRQMAEDEETRNQLLAAHQGLGILEGVEPIRKLMMQELLRVAPEQPEILISAAMEAYQSGHPKEALKLMDKAIANSPPEHRETLQQMRDQLAESGESHVVGGKPITPNTDELAEEIQACDALHKEGKHAEAEKARKKLDPMAAEALPLLWLWRSDQTAFDDKVRQMAKDGHTRGQLIGASYGLTLLADTQALVEGINEELLRAAPDDFEVLVNLAGLAYQTGDPKRALELIDRAMANAPDDQREYVEMARKEIRRVAGA